MATLIFCSIIASWTAFVLVGMLRNPPQFDES
jgi:hypothetical protein